MSAISWRCAATRRAGSQFRYAPHPDGYLHAADLVAGIKRAVDAEITVSAYPEKHPDSPNVDADIDMLRAKVAAGATRAITQFFFDNDLYFRYLDRVRARGINVPIVPGHPAGAELRAGEALRAALRHQCAGLAGAPLRRAR